MAPLRTVSKGHRLKESFPTRCVPSRVVIRQTHEKHPLTTEENSLRDKGDSCTNIFSMPGLSKSEIFVSQPSEASYMVISHHYQENWKAEHCNIWFHRKAKRLVNEEVSFCLRQNLQNLLTLLKRLGLFCFSTSWLSLTNTWATFSFSIQITKYPWRAWHSSRTTVSGRLLSAAEWHSHQHLPGQSATSLQEWLSAERKAEEGCK